MGGPEGPLRGRRTQAYSAKKPNGPTHSCFLEGLNPPPEKVDSKAQNNTLATVSVCVCGGVSCKGWGNHSIVWWGNSYQPCLLPKGPVSSGELLLRNPQGYPAGRRVPQQDAGSICPEGSRQQLPMIRFHPSLGAAPTLPPPRDVVSPLPPEFQRHVSITLWEVFHVETLEQNNKYILTALFSQLLQMSLQRKFPHRGFQKIFYNKEAVGV